MIVSAYPIQRTGKWVDPATLAGDLTPPDPPAIVAVVAKPVVPDYTDLLTAYILARG